MEKLSNKDKLETAVLAIWQNIPLKIYLEKKMLVWTP